VTWWRYQSLGTEVIIPNWCELAVLYTTGMVLVGRRSGDVEAPLALMIPGTDEEFERIGPARMPNGYGITGRCGNQDVLIRELYLDIAPALVLLARRNEVAIELEETDNEDCEEEPPAQEPRPAREESEKRGGFGIPRSVEARKRIGEGVKLAAQRRHEEASGDNES